ncbi:MAG: hypothetical protein CMJ36_00390 [Phycisphaerae bacterium]|nr:hypothetical protein [Phycisphaerae bacterium]
MAVHIVDGSIRWRIGGGWVDLIPPSGELPDSRGSIPCMDTSSEEGTRLRLQALQAEESHDGF